MKFEKITENKVKIIVPFEELELPDNSFEVVKGYNQYENEKWEIISTESQNLD